MCGLNSTLGTRFSRLVVGKWLDDKAVQARAPARWPDSRASQTASSSTSTPRAVLINSEPGFILASVSRLISGFEPGPPGMCRLTMSDCGPDLIERHQPDVVLGGILAVGQRIVGDDLHVQTGGPRGDRLADPAEADQPQRQAGQPRIGIAPPTAVADRPIALDH